jgi:hypothetical protein
VSVALVVACAALLVALVAVTLAISVMRQSAETTTDLRMHRRAHTIAHGHADPKLDRRQVQLGPPRATGERRGVMRYPEPRERYAPRPPDPDLDADQRDPLDDLPATGELEQTDLPTSMLAAQRPAPPDVRDVRARRDEP